jgi:ankyrin repeat protein
MNMIERIARGRTDLVFDYVEQGGDAQSVEAQGVSLIRWCAYFGDVSAIRYLLSRGEILESLGDNYDLNGAAFHGHWRLCEYLVEQGADVNRALPDTGETPLHAALCKANRPTYDRVVKVLLGGGANPNAVTRTGMETGCFMRDCRTRGETALHRAAAYGSEPVIQMLLEAGAVVDAKDVHGETPLSWASRHLRPDSILRRLCHGGYTIHAQRRSTYDHGLGVSAMEESLAGEPHG